MVELVDLPLYDLSLYTLQRVYAFSKIIQGVRDKDNLNCAHFNDMLIAERGFVGLQPWGFVVIS